MTTKKISRTKQIVCTIRDLLRDQKEDWIGLFIGTVDLRYRRLFFGGGVSAVYRRFRQEEIHAHAALLRRLQQQKCIALRRIGNEMRITLTEKGKRIAMREQMRNAPSCKRNECVIVIFDIPEREQSARKQFRLLLKECGFEQLQRSVWMSRCDVLDTLRSFIHSTNCNKWIRVFRAMDVL